MHPLLIASFLFLTLGSTGYAKETISDSSADHAPSNDVSSGLSRSKRGNFNFRRWNRGLQMLRLGKRDSTDDFDGNVDNEHKPFYYERDLYGLADGDLGKSNLHTDGYLLAPSGDDDFNKRSLAMLRLGKRLSNDMDDGTTDDKRTLNMLRLGKRQLEMLRLGKRGGDISERSMAQLRLGKRLSDLSDADSSLYDDKRNLNMLRLGKRHMQMLRLGKREDDAVAESDLGDLPFLDGESPSSMSRLGKRNMQMLRLGKRADDSADTASPLGPLRLGDIYPHKRTLNMLRLGKRDSDNSADSV